MKEYLNFFKGGGEEGRVGCLTLHLNLYIGDFKGPLASCYRLH